MSTMPDAGQPRIPSRTSSAPGPGLLVESSIKSGTKEEMRTPASASEEASAGLGLGLGLMGDNGAGITRPISPVPSGSAISLSSRSTSSLMPPPTPHKDHSSHPQLSTPRHQSPPSLSPRQARTPSPLFGRPISRVSGQSSGTGNSSWMGNGKETISPGKAKRAGLSKEDIVGTVKAALFGHASATGGWDRGGSKVTGRSDVRSSGSIEILAQPVQSPIHSGSSGTITEQVTPVGAHSSLEVQQEQMRGSHRSGNTIRRSTIHNGDGATQQGSWMVSVCWTKASERSRKHGQRGRAKEDGDKIDVYVNAPDHQDTLIRTLGDIRELDFQLRRHQVQNLPALPPVFPFGNGNTSPNPTESVRSQSSYTTRSTSSQGPNGSPAKKSRQSPFLSAFSNKMRSTIRGTSGTSTSPTKRPALHARETEPKPPPAERIASPPSKRATIHLSEGEGLDLGNFDFEGGPKGDVPALLDPTLLSRSSSPSKSPMIAGSGCGDVRAARESPGLSFEDATALVAAMAEHPDLANSASLPASSIASSNGIPPVPLGAVVGSVPPMSLTEALLASPAELTDAKVSRPKSEEHDIVTSLSDYLSALANDPSIRGLSPWRKFIGARASDLTHKTERQERTMWQAHGEEILANSSPADADEAEALELTQRKKAIKRSRSLGNGILSTMFGQKDAITPTPVESAISAVADERPLPPSSSKSGDCPPAQDPQDLLRSRPETLGSLSSPAATAGHRGDEIMADSPSVPALSVDIPMATPNAGKWTSGDKSDGMPAQLTAPTTPNLSISSRSDTQPTSTDAAEMTPSKSEVKRGRLGRRDVKVEDFELLKVLGRGCAGKVVLVKQKDTAKLFAMKIIVKKHVLAHSELQHTLTEQSVLRRVAEKADDMDQKNPFVVKMWYSFFDDDNLYLVLDFHPGGDLATQLSRWGRLGRDRARFYASEIVEGVERLHAAGVIYRDLKPENVLLGSDGHIVLVDFGLAAWFPDSRGPAATLPHWMGGQTDEQDLARPHLERHASANAAAAVATVRDTASSFVGTAEYLAPEVIKGDPYSYEVDWWSLGTMLYEALMGSTPFWAENHAEMYTRVVHEQLAFPDSSYLDKDTRSFLRGLLQKDPAFRLSEPRIKKHPYLSMVNFDHVRHKRYIPPYIPPTDSSKDFDTQNFDKQFLELSPALGDDGPGDNESDGEGDADETKTDVVMDDSVFSGYIFKDRQIPSMYFSEEQANELAEQLLAAEAQEEADLTTPTARRSSQEHVEPYGVIPVDTPDASSFKEATQVGVSDEADHQRDGGATEHDSIVEDEERTLEQQPIGSRPSPAILERIHSIASADHIKASNRKSRDFTNAGRASMEQLNRIASPWSKVEADAGQPRSSEDDEWDLVDDHPDQAENGSETFFGRGIVDKYKLAVLRRKESTVRRKQSSNLRKSPSSSLFFAGSGGSGTGVFKSRLKLRAKSPKKVGPGPPLSRGASQSNTITRTSLDAAIANAPGTTMSRRTSESSQGRLEINNIMVPPLTAPGTPNRSSPERSILSASSTSERHEVAS